MKVDRGDFWARTERKGSGCWEWRGSRTAAGYGQLQSGGRRYYAHRVAWHLTHGERPGRMLVCHYCDNPSCVRPDHLFLGTQRDNMRDAIRKGRWSPPDNPPGVIAGEKCGTAKLTWEAVDDIRSRRQGGERSVELAKEYGVSCFTVYDILSGRTWKDEHRP